MELDHSDQCVFLNENPIHHLKCDCGLWQVAELKDQTKILAEALELLTSAFNILDPGKHDNDNWYSPHIEGECDHCIYGGYYKIGREALDRARNMKRID